MDEHDLAKRLMAYDTSTPAGITTGVSFIKGWLENESRLIEQGIETGVFDAGLDPYTFSLLAWRLSTGLIELALLQDPMIVNRGELDDVFEQSIDLLIKGSRPDR